MSDQIDLMEQILKLTRMVRRRPMGERNISRGEQRVVEVLLHSDGMRTTDLAEKLDIRPSSLTEVMKKLEDKRYLRREPDLQDSRVSRAYITEMVRGEQAKWNADNLRQRARLNECLTQEEAESFSLICNKLCAFFEQEYGTVEHDSHRRGHGRSTDHRHERHRDSRRHGRRHDDDEKEPDNKQTEL